MDDLGRRRCRSVGFEAGRPGYRRVFFFLVGDLRREVCRYVTRLGSESLERMQTKVMMHMIPPEYHHHYVLYMLLTCLGYILTNFSWGYILTNFSLGYILTNFSLGYILTNFRLCLHESCCF
jgi:hypothetical protein